MEIIGRRLCYEVKCSNPLIYPSCVSPLNDHMMEFNSHEYDMGVAVFYTNLYEGEDGLDSHNGIVVNGIYSLRSYHSRWMDLNWSGMNIQGSPDVNKALVNVLLLTVHPPVSGPTHDGPG